MIKSLKQTHFSLEKIQKFLIESTPSIKNISKDRYHSVLFTLPRCQEMFIRVDEKDEITAMVNVFIEARITHKGDNICHAHDLVVKDNDEEIKKEMVNHISLYAKEKECKVVIWVTDTELKTTIGNAPLETSDMKVLKIRLSN